jgi:ParB family chromosome partitioning protein
MIIEDGFSIIDSGFAGFREGVEDSNESNLAVTNIDVNKIIPNKYQPRKHFDADSLQELADSIKELGVIQPILVSSLEEEGKYMLIAGERRLRASKLANLKEVPVIISEYTNEQIAEIALIENLQRENLNFFEEAEGYAKLMFEFKLTQEAAASRVGKKQSTIANKVRLLRLPSEVKKIIMENKLSERHARALLKLPLKEVQLEMANNIVKKSLNVRQTEKLIEDYLREHECTKKKRKDTLIIVKDVRLYLNSIKQIVKNIDLSGIPVKMEQSVEGEEVIVTLKIANTKGKNIAKVTKK